MRFALFRGFEQETVIKGQKNVREAMETIADYMMSHGIVNTKVYKLVNGSFEGRGYQVFKRGDGMYCYKLSGLWSQVHEIKSGVTADE